MVISVIYAINISSVGVHLAKFTAFPPHFNKKLPRKNFPVALGCTCTPSTPWLRLWLWGIKIIDLSSSGKHRKGKRTHRESTTVGDADSEEQSPATDDNDSLRPASSHNQRAVSNWRATRDKYRMWRGGRSWAVTAAVRMFLARRRRLAQEALLDLQEP